MKQITIYDLLPLLRKGWVAMDKNGEWWWYEQKPEPHNTAWRNKISDAGANKTWLCCFNIKFDGDWKDSLMECGK